MSSCLFFSEEQTRICSRHKTDFPYLSSQLGTNYIPTEEEVLHIEILKLEVVERELERIEASS